MPGIENHMDWVLHDADIYLVGVGLFDLQQVTLETVAILRRAKLVLHLTAKHDQLRELNPNTRDLTPRYLQDREDWTVYQDLARFVVSESASNRPTVFAVDGNPMIFNDISWEISRLGNEIGLRVQALPGVSTLDVLPIQLGFDIGDVGLQVFEATQLVLFKLPLNPHLSTLIFQVGEFGTSRLAPRHEIVGRFNPLIEHLVCFFPEDHPAIFILSATMANVPTVVFAIRLQSIDDHRNRISPGMTLYLPRVSVPQYDVHLAKKIGVGLEYLFPSHGGGLAWKNSLGE